MVVYRTKMMTAVDQTDPQVQAGGFGRVCFVREAGRMRHVSVCDAAQLPELPCRLQRDGFVTFILEVEF